MNTIWLLRKQKLITGPCHVETELAEAKAWAMTYPGLAVVMGEDEQYWTVSVEDAARLKSAGYELA